MDTPPGKSVGDAPDFLDGPADQILMVYILDLFWGRGLIGAVSDHRHHCEGKHDKGHMAMPAMPGPGFIAIKVKLIPGCLEAVFDCPAMAFDGNERLDVRSGWASGREEGQVIIADIAPDQKPARPEA